MKVYGLDFTSTPSDKKPITVANCFFADALLTVESLCEITSWQAFTVFLSEAGDWIGGIDFPFGQPIRLISNLGWPSDWEGYVRHTATYSKSKYTALINEYRARQPDGEKEHFRRIDRLAGSLSPMKMYGIPTGKMFHQGAPFLLTSPCRIFPFRVRGGHSATLVESYPGLVARKFIERRPYKNDSPDKQTDAQQQARADVLDAIASTDGTMRDRYGFHVSMLEELIREGVEDRTGDKLDSILSAIQAAWAYAHREVGFGAPDDDDVLLEGWIPDPPILQAELTA